MLSLHGVMLSIFFALLVVVTGQDCLRANNLNGLPPFMDYRGSDLRSDTIPELHQIIVPSYRFTCCGTITEWGVDVHPGGGNFDGFYILNLQVWRPLPAVEATGCYSLVGNNRFTSVTLTSQVAMVTPLPQERIKFQPGDVLGFSVENTNRNDGGAVLLMDYIEQGDSVFETEEVWYGDLSNPLIAGNGQCPFPVGSQPGRILNTFTNAAPVISVSYTAVSCPPNIVPTSIPIVPTLTDTSQPNPPVTDPSEVTTDLSKTEETHSSDPFSDIGVVVGIIVVVLMVVTIVILAAVLGFITRIKKQKKDIPMVTNEAYGTGLQDTAAVFVEGDTYDYPSMDDQAKSSIDTKINEAYATNAETKPCVAYATNISTERNDAYGIKPQGAAMCREGDTCDYPTMDS